MIAIIKKELWTLLGQYMGWLIIAGFSVVSTLFLFFFENDANIFDIGVASLQSFFGLCPWLFMFTIPALTMRTLAEEQQQGTLLTLFSLPLKTSDIVIGKFISVYIVGLLCILPALVYLYTIHILGVPEGNFDGGATLGSFLGLILLLGVFIGIGIFSSALASHQVAAYLLGMAISFVLFFGIQQISSYQLLGSADYFLSEIGLYSHYIAFSRGLIDTKDLAYLLFIILLTIFGSVYVMNQKK
ncbi:ABC transporter permease subunit [Bergeyella zoohelcum]|uniref:Gliding motility-associated ABC transporter permease GldF n=1 Tax=Bergeyella zoohelcum ATCC 43767 TaxID=883096 RepID=K1MIZ8_9FLAO|nr:ABC transporter permease subunit [Bergeyella zoohelcum]EKB55869.1 hypothetical protein HMPREF9699_01514 [Bergeyella zoohelcum ATCC 43767]SUV50407.1 ABC-type transport system involved in multi-copper enzyme maturation, permease component [Bergeyella zoohelcum]